RFLVNALLLAIAAVITVAIRVIAISVVFRAGRQALGDRGFLLRRSPGFTGIGEIFPSIIAIQNTFAGQALKDFGDDLDEATLQRAGLGGGDQLSIFILSPIDLIEH